MTLLIPIITQINMPVPQAAHTVPELLTSDERRPKHVERCYQ